MDFYSTLVFVCGALFLFVQCTKPRSQRLVMSSPTFCRFQRSYLLVYFLMITADWLQGPYVYRLYSFYGFSKAQNGLLFIAGFGSSMLTGPFAGTLADKYGRRLTCLIYAVSYIASCLTKHVPVFSVLMLGRILGGFATSILWSAFESWMVSEHRSRGFDDESLADTFGLQIAGSGLVAIASGFLAQAAVSLMGGHPVVPFDVAIVFLVVGSSVILMQWPENYGDRDQSTQGLLSHAWHAIISDECVLLTGVCQALFEGAMYTFVFMWTPMLEAASQEPIPHGLIFAAMMMCTSIGAALFGPLSSRYPAHVFMQGVFVVAAASMFIPLIVPSSEALIMCSFCIFEGCVGIFWPAVMQMRSQFLPEDTRATIINIFRVPLNVLVCTVLLLQGHLKTEQSFLFCVAFHVLCAVLTRRLSAAASRRQSSLDVAWKCQHTTP